jgi:hypothetical protein
LCVQFLSIDWAGKKHLENVDDLSHELYNLGHYYETATAYYQSTGKRKILDIAIKSADLINNVFGYGKIESCRSNRSGWPLGARDIHVVWNGGCGCIDRR